MNDETSRMTMRVPRSMRRTSQATQDQWVGSAVAIIELMCRHLGVSDMAELSMLDVGCGTKLTKAFTEHGLPIRRYVGVDVYREMIDHLESTVTDPRFEYRHVDLQNDMYNPTGRPMTECAALPVDEQFDVIGLFSVFTHLAPGDFREMLRLLRPCAKPDARLFFSLYINETTENGHGLIDKVMPDVAQALRDNPQLLEQYGSGAPADFTDLLPDRPLQNAMYSRPFALSLVEESDWEMESLNPPEWFIQHYFVCRPG